MTLARPRARVLLVGAGGVGAPAALALAASGEVELVVVDDDEVAVHNLHRQILFAEGDVGRPKLEAFAERLRERFPDVRLELVSGRVLPDVALALVSTVDVVLDATDNFASRFLAADACALAERPVIHAAAVRTRATVTAVGPHVRRGVGQACYRCLFEDLPEGDAPDCATAGVLGPVCGVSGALAADRVLREVRGDESKRGTVISFDGLADRLREVRFRPRADCALSGASPSIHALDEARYVGPACG